MGIGIHTGEVVVGNIGSEKRTKYGAVGPSVNLAARIEANTVGGQILISESTHRPDRRPAARSTTGSRSSPRASRSRSPSSTSAD